MDRPRPARQVAGVIPFLVLVSLAWAVQAMTGKVIGRGWRPQWARAQQPRAFWGILSIQGLAIACLWMAVVLSR